MIFRCEKKKQEMDSAQFSVRNDNLKNKKYSSLNVTEQTSLSSLIVWNISKALEKSPSLDIKEAVASTQSHLEHTCDSREIQSILCNNPHERHLACALLAWQQLGHSDADSLCRFVENRSKKKELPSKLSQNYMQFPSKSLSRTSKASKMSTKIAPTDLDSTSQRSGRSRYETADEGSAFTSYNSFLMGPVVKLPVEAQVVMRLDNTSHCKGRKCVQAKKTKTPERDIIKKIDQACCLDSACAERLAAMDATSTELRARVGMLARREAERVELLERAEAAWKDLELGYQRRLALAEEKEEDIAKQISTLLEERVNYKNVCTTLAKDLKDRSDRAEIERVNLSELEKTVCDRACHRMKASEESAKGDALAAEQSCKAAQLDRDLQFKEETARRNLLAVQGEVRSIRALTSDLERATRTELGSLRDQINEVSRNLLQQDAINEKSKAELENLRQEKTEIIEDLDGCKVTCDANMQGLMDELKAKRDQLAKLREKVMECKCKVPIEVAVEVKRTPSLAALCKCTPEDKVLESCSCTSMRARLLSNLFADLFSGLQTEMKGAVTMMPCQLLKCLEDKHNWDRASVVKTNLKNYFSKLLVGELDIAIATSIEHYHAKWVGISCADARSKMKPGPGDDTESEGWQERAIERRAKTLATQLAEQLFQERAEELTQRAQDIVNAGPLPCECDAKAKLPEGCFCGKLTAPLAPPTSPAMKPAAVDTATKLETIALRSVTKDAATKDKPETEMQVFWHEATKNVTQPRHQFANYQRVGGLPERDFNVEVEKKLAKKCYGKVVTHSGEAKKYSGGMKGGSAKENVPHPVIVRNTALRSSPPMTPPSWQYAMQDVTRLRYEIEDLKKDSIKKEDLKIMEDKIAKIINGALGSTASTNQKMKYVNAGNVTNAASKYLKTNRIIKQSKSHFTGIEKPSATKKTKVGSMTKDIKAKPHKKTTPAYAVNVCLCSTNRQEQKDRTELNEKLNLQKSSYRQKDTVSQISSSVKQSKPMKNSFLSQDTTLSYSLDYDEKSCPSNCVCFHKIPSNTSIDKLLETLAKWKVDLDVSFTENDPQKKTCCDSQQYYNRNNYRCSLDDSTNFGSKTTLKSKEKSQEKPNQKREEDINVHSSIILEATNIKVIENTVDKLSVPIATESVYMGAVSLDKSHEEFCKCDNVKVIKKTPFKCLASSNCECEKKIGARRDEKQTKQINKEYEEICVIQTNQEHIKIIPDIPNTSNDKETNKVEEIDNKVQEKDVNTNMIDKKTNVETLKSSEYQINFLGVTLVDVNHPTKNQLLLESKRNSYNDMKNLKNNAVFNKAYYLGNKNKHKQNDYFGKSYRPVPHLTNYIDSIDNRNKNVLISNDNVNEGCIIAGNIKYKDICKYCNETNQANLNEFISYMDEIDVSQLRKDSKYKYSDIGYKTASDQNASNVFGDNDLYLKSKEDVNAKNSHESDVSKKSFITASESSQLFDKTTAKTKYLYEKILEKSIKREQSSLSNKNIITAHNPQTLSCECSVLLDEFKKYINDNFAEHADIEDKALDIPSINHFKERGESCICCSKLNDDECNNLEENTFHLIQEYLKKKLNDFKASTSNKFCIPTEEEEKIFSIIVQRVKRLISDSTNQISCKCLKKERKSQGSWNRAYGLLQEYLKIKINKVQCSCLLVEDNKNTILPDVLEKISNLIEYDFERLKNVCAYIKRPSTEENTVNIGKQVNFKTEMPRRDQYQKDFSDISPLDDKENLTTYHTIQLNYLKQSLQSQLPLTLSREDENFDSKFNVKSSIHLLHNHENCDINTVDEVLDKNLKDSQINEISVSDTNFTKTTDDITPEITREIMKNDCLVNKSADKRKKTKKEDEINNKLNESENHISNFVTTLHSPDSKFEQKISHNNMCHLKDAVSINNIINKNNEENWRKLQESSKTNSFKVPYFGYTITCSCDEKLGPCICPKNLPNTDPAMINDIWKKSTPDKYMKKFSYILPKKAIDIIDLKKNSQEIFDEGMSPQFKKNPLNNLIKNEATCCAKSGQIVLKTSSYDVMQAHAETNTFKDYASANTDCSNNEDEDWRECTSQYSPRKYAGSDRLTRSIYYPAPIEDFEEQTKDKYVSDENILSTLPKDECHCEKIPLCHVKMLVENIETKLANANCTCDSLIPKVCPVHSTMC